MKEACSLFDGGSRDVVIAMVDTGIDYTHEELRKALWTNAGEIPENNVDDDGNGYVDDVHGWNFCDDSNQIYVSREADDHGTHGAGTIAASSDNETGFFGIVDSDHAKIMFVKVLKETGARGSPEMVARAIRYAEENGASICNLSLGLPEDDPALYQAIANSSMLFVAAAMLYSYHADITLADVKEILLSSVTKLDTLSGRVASGGMLNLGAAMAYDTDTLSHKAWNTPSP